MGNTGAVSNYSYLVLEAEHFHGSVRLRQASRQRFRLTISLQARGLAARSDSERNQECAGCEHARHAPHQTSFTTRNSTNASLMLQETVAESGAEVAVVTRINEQNGNKDLSGFGTPSMSPTCWASLWQRKSARWTNETDGLRLCRPELSTNGAPGQKGCGPGVQASQRALGLQRSRSSRPLAKSPECVQLSGEVSRCLVRDLRALLSSRKRW